jgi:hypothetical protein
MMLNDVILRTAFDERVDVLDLRTVCDEACNYANPIQPSGEGGRKIALVIANIIRVKDRAAPSRSGPRGAPFPDSNHH